MSPLTVLALTVLLFLAIVGGVAGIVLERQRSPFATPLAESGRPRRPAADRRLGVAVRSRPRRHAGRCRDPSGRLQASARHAGRAAALLCRASTLRLIYRSLRRFWARMRSDGPPFEPRPLPVPRPAGVSDAVRERRSRRAERAALRRADAEPRLHRLHCRSARHRPQDAASGCRAGATRRRRMKVAQPWWRGACYPLHSDFDWLDPGQSSSGSCCGSTSTSMLRATLGCLLMKPARSSVSTIW